MLSQIRLLLIIIVAADAVTFLSLFKSVFKSEIDDFTYYPQNDERIYDSYPQDSYDDGFNTVYTYPGDYKDVYKKPDLGVKLPKKGRTWSQLCRVLYPDSSRKPGKAGVEIEVEIELTANHLGTFVMKMCPNNNPKQEATQECFDRYPLYISGTREDRFLIPLDTAKKDTFRYRVRLPPYVTCTQCVLQWTYYTGNMWGICPNGTEAVGCGRSETFRNCADISVVTNTGGLPPAFASDFRRDNPFLLYYRDAFMPQNVYPLVIRDQVCLPSESYARIPGMLNWCQTNCLRYPPHCPDSLCNCPSICEAIGELEGKEGADVYCMDQCIVYPPHCPKNRCRCY